MDLPVVQCPAGNGLESADGNPAVLCNLMQDERRRTDQIVFGESTPGFYTAARDPNTVFGWCCGTGLPVVDGVPEQGRGHYTGCPIWRREVKRREAGDENLIEHVRRESTTPFGLTVPEMEALGGEHRDPYAAQRATIRDLNRMAAVEKVQEELAGVDR